MREIQVGETKWLIDEERMVYTTLIGNGNAEFGTWLPYTSFTDNGESFRIERPDEHALSISYRGGAE